MMETTNGVAVIDGDEQQRREVVRLLQSTGLAAVAFASAESFLSAGGPSETGCVVTEMRMAGMSGLQLQEELGALDAAVPLIMVTAFADVAAAVRSMKAGAFDFIQKPFSPQLLIDTVRLALRESEDRRREQRASADVRARFETLTTRERQVMRLVAGGTANKAIARQLDLAEKTVEFHRAKVMSKMRAESVADLVRMSLACPRPNPAGELRDGPVRRELRRLPVHA